jgi:List-Bact-rpt repeat protein
MRRGDLLLVGLVALFVVSSLPALGAPSSAHLVSPQSVHPDAGAPTGSGRATPAAVPSIASGAGTFFTTSSVPAPAAAALTCFFGTCVTAADDPSLNLTTTGALVVAYATWTTQAPCTAARTSAQTEIGVVHSTNLGGTWSSPVYLGNSNCTTPTVGDYPSAWEPTLTSLANGTLVLAYIEYNVSAGNLPPRLSFQASSPSVTYDRLVVTRSFDGGAQWTSPIVVNTSANPGLSAPAFPPQRPSVTAIGDTVYLAWMNLTDQLSSPTSGSSAVHLVVSTDGGAAFSAPTDLSTIATSGTSVAMNPSLAVDPSGRLYVAYATNLTYTPVVGCPSSGCYYGGWTASVVVATSTNNGTSFSYAAIPGSVIVPPTRWGTFFDPSPVLAVGPGGTQVFVAYSGGYLTPLCSIYGCYTGFGAQLAVSNSSDDGATFSAPHAVDPSVAGGDDDGANTLYNPAIAVSPDGILQLTATYDNFSVCAQNGLSTWCGPQAQVYVNSSDNGTTFSSPIYVNDNSTQIYTDPNNPDGEQASLLTAGSEVLLAWTSDICDSWNTTVAFTACPWPGTGGASGVQVSELYQGTGLTLTFSETGLAAGTNWTADVLGNVRASTAPTNLVFTGVPDGFNATWNVTVESAYGYQYTPTFSLSNPAILTASTTVSISYTTQVLFDLQSVPNLPPYAYGVPGCGYGFYWNVTACPAVNWNITPSPGAIWVTPGTVIPLSATPNDVIYCTLGGACYDTYILNLTFLSWKGTGDSASNTTSYFTNVTVNGPVNETASFAYDGWCYYEWVPVYYTCLGPNETSAFHESGLPTGTDWTVTLGSANASVSNSSTTTWNLFNTTFPGTFVDYTVATIADGSTGEYWVPTSTPASPIVQMTEPLVNVTFTLEALSAATFPVSVSTTNLPGSPNWGYSIDSSGYASSGASAAPVDVSGGSHSLSASPVVLTNSSRYLPYAADTYDYTGTGTWTNFSKLPAALAVDGATEVYLIYATQYWLQATASSCGNVSASSGWYDAGATVSLTATPSANCTFVGWSGAGPGATSSASRSIVAIVNGPVTELAVFAPSPPVTWSISVAATGLPSGTSFTVGLAGQLYTGAGPLVIRGLATGVYPLTLPYVYLNGTDGTRFVPAVSSTTYSQVSGGYLVGADGSINLTFSTEYLVNVTAGPGGTVSSAGAGWYAAGSFLPLMASPSIGDVFVGWSGSGAAAASSNQPALDLDVFGPASEVASFTSAPVSSIETFAVTVSETGLASGISWSAEIGATGYATLSGLLTAQLPNGTYEVALPIVSGPTGVRYVPDPAFTNVTVSGSGAVASVSYSTQYYVTLAASPGGSINVSSGWYDSGTVLRVGATPTNSSETFENWTGAGAAAYTGTQSSITLTVSGPIAEAASFAPPGPAATSGSSPSSASSGLAISVGLLAVLLVVGLVVGFLLLRRRPPAEPEPGPEHAAAEGGELYGAEPPPSA